MSVFQPLISKYIGGKVMTFEYKTFRKQTLMRNFEDFQGLLHLYCFEWL